MKLEYDHSRINWAFLPDNITLSETNSVLNDRDNMLVWLPGYPMKDAYNLICGYSSKKRILLVATCLIETKLIILQVKVADKDEIKQYYCC